MSKALVITAYLNGSCNQLLSKLNYDTVICADGGLEVAERLNLQPDILIGDYDSMPLPKNRNVIRLPMEKDMTDSEAAIDLAFSKGFDDVLVIGGLGGRFDHTMGNIGILAKYCKEPVTLAFADEQNYIFMVSPGRITIPKNNYKYLGIISYSPITSGLTIKGVKYPLNNFKLKNNTSLGVSNEIIDKNAEIEFNSGQLLIVLSNDLAKG